MLTNNNSIRLLTQPKNTNKQSQWEYNALRPHWHGKEGLLANHVDFIPGHSGLEYTGTGHQPIN